MVLLHVTRTLLMPHVNHLFNNENCFIPYSSNDESIDAWCHSRIKLPWKFLHTYSQILNLTLLDSLPSSWGITVLNNTLLNYLQFANHVAPSAIPLVVSPSWNDPDFSQLTPDLPVKIQHLKSPPTESLPRLWLKAPLLCLPSAYITVLITCIQA